MNTRTHRLRDERGNAMVITLMIMLVLTAVGIGFVLQSKTETQIAGNDMRWSQALYNAEAGLAEGKARLSDPQDATNFVGENPNDPPDIGWVRYIVANAGDSALDPDRALYATDGLDNNGDGNVDESGEVPPEVLTAQTGDAIDYPWVRVEYVIEAGNVVRFGDHDDDLTTPQIYNFVDGAPVVRITAAGRRGTAERTVQIEAVKPDIDMVKAAIYTEDDDFTFNGTQFLVDGTDYDMDTELPSGDPPVRGIATTQDPDNITGSLSGAQVNNVEGAGGSPSVSTAEADLDLQAMRDMFAQDADLTIAPGTYANQSWGTNTDWKITHVQGDLHTSGPVDGYGVLVIDGDFDCTGAFSWYGLVIVLGDIRFSGGGNQVKIIGACLVQGGTDDQTVGGNVDVKYSSEALDRLTRVAKYTTVSWIEL